MSSAVLVRVCVMLVSHRIASVQNSEMEKPVSEENLFEAVLVSLSLWELDWVPDLQNQIARICTNLSGQPEVRDFWMWMWGGARYLYPERAHSQRKGVRMNVCAYVFPRRQA